jgi:DNA-binding GntR family transcriptional regulator
LDKLEELLNIMENTEDVEIYLKANKQYHDTIYKEAGVPIMLEIIDSLWERYSPYFYILLQDEVSRIAAEFHKTHRGMMRGMRRKDPEEVRKWLEKDLTGAAKMLLVLLEQEDES